MSEEAKNLVPIKSSIVGRCKLKVLGFLKRNHVSVTLADTHVADLVLKGITSGGFVTVGVVRIEA